MALPLADGMFAALVLAGALDTVGGILQVGLLVFGGSATVAVVMAEMNGSPRTNARRIALVGALLIPIAAIEAALAPTIGQLLNLVVFERFAALVILAVAARTASARVAALLPRPAVIVGLGLLASLDPWGASLVLQLEPGIVGRAVAAAGLGVSLALAVAWFAPILRGAVDLDRFRFGSAVALGTLPLGLFGVIPTNAPLVILAVVGVLSVDLGDRSDRGRQLQSVPGNADEVSLHSESGSSERAPWL